MDEADYEVVRQIMAQRQQMEAAHLRERLRDQFAGQALMGLLAAPETRGSCEEFAAAAYRYADAMLEVRKEKGND